MESFIQTVHRIGLHPPLLHPVFLYQHSYKMADYLLLNISRTLPFEVLLPDLAMRCGSAAVRTVPIVCARDQPSI